MVKINSQLIKKHPTLGEYQELMPYSYNLNMEDLVTGLNLLDTISSISALYVIYNTNRDITRLQIIERDRHPGFVLSFVEGEEILLKKYMSTSITDEDWINEFNWYDLVPVEVDLSRYYTKQEINIKIADINQDITNLETTVNNNYEDLSNLISDLEGNISVNYVTLNTLLTITAEKVFEANIRTRNIVPITNGTTSVGGYSNRYHSIFSLNSYSSLFIVDLGTSSLFLKADGTLDSNQYLRTIRVGSTVTGTPGSNALVSYTNSNAETILNFVIPRGDPGINGDYTVFIYKLSLTRPATPTGDNPSDWEDYPSDTGKWWMSLGEFDGNTHTLIGTWSEPVLVTAFDGSYIDFKYAVNNSATSAPSIVLTDRNPVGWSDVPPSIGTDLYMWLTQGEIDHTDSLVGTWSTPTRISGVTGSHTDFKYTKNTSSTTAPSIVNTDRLPAGWTDAPPTISDGEFLWLTQAEIDWSDALIGTWATPVRISGDKGDLGDQGEGGDYTLYIFYLSDTKPSRPTTTTSNPLPSGWLDAPTSDNKWWMSTARFDGEDDTIMGIWSDPVQVTAEDGLDGNYTKFIFYQSTERPSTPTTTTALPLPNGWADSPNDEGRWWMSQATFDGETDVIVGTWSVPILVTAEDGAPAAYVILTGSNLFVLDATGTVTPPSITLEANLFNFDDSAVILWFYLTVNTPEPVEILANAGNTTYTVDPNSTLFAGVSEVSYRCQVTWNSTVYYDIITIAKIRDGLDGQDGEDGSNGESTYRGLLSNEVIIVTANYLGVPDASSVADAFTDYALYYGTSKLTYGTDYTITVTKNEASNTSTFSNDTSTLTLKLLTLDTALNDVSFTVNWIVDGNIVDTKDWAITKSLGGVPGNDGTNGIDGLDGNSNEFRYAVNTSMTSAPSIVNSDRNPSGWVTSPPTLSAGQYMWMVTAVIKPDNTLQGLWSAPVRISGEKGADGLAATITVGTTTTLPAGENATVSNSGTSGAVILDFGIPQGIQGVKGDTGATGATGPQGPKGDNGDSGILSFTLSASGDYVSNITYNSDTKAMSVTKQFASNIINDSLSYSTLMFADNVVSGPINGNIQGSIIRLGYLVFVSFIVPIISDGNGFNSGVVSITVPERLPSASLLQYLNNSSGIIESNVVAYCETSWQDDTTVLVRVAVLNNADSLRKLGSIYHSFTYVADSN